MLALVKKRISGLLMIGIAFAGTAAHAELVEEVVAWVNGEIITMSEFEAEEGAVVAEAYRRYAGAELDTKVEEIRAGMLSEMIDRKILLDYARRIYDVERMGEAFFQSFRDQQGIEDDAEFERMLIQEGTTVEEMKQRLIEMFAPDEVLRSEVRSRISISDKEIETFYEEHADELVVPGEATLREIVLLADDSRKDERRAEAGIVRERARAGDFATIAEELSEAGTKEQGGLLGTLKKGDLSGELEEIAFSLPVGEISEVLEMPYGFHILKVESRTEEGARPLEEVREVLRRGLEERKYFLDLVVFLEKARTEADWCVKPKYQHRIALGTEHQNCSDL